MPKRGEARSSGFTLWRYVIFMMLDSWRCISNPQGEVLKYASPDGVIQYPNHTKRVLGGGWYKDNQSNACPDELHEYDGTKHLAYLNYDDNGHGGAHIQNMSDKYWDLVLPHSHLGERLYVEKLLVSDGVCYTRMFQSEISSRH